MGKESEAVFNPKPGIVKRSYVQSMEEYKLLHKKSIENPAEFWGEIAKQFHWETPIDSNKFFSYNFDITKGPIDIKWMPGATTNICFNLLDKNVKCGLGDKIAYYW